MNLKPAADDAPLHWVKSGYSTPDGAACVEVATEPDTVRIRDSKQLPGPHLTFSPHQWTAFLPYASGHR